MAPGIKTSQSIVLVAAAVCLTCACGIPLPAPKPPPPPPPPATPQVSVSIEALVFQGAVGTTSQAQQVLVRNLTGHRLKLQRPVLDYGTRGTITPSYAFRIKDDCGRALPPLAECAIGVTFRPAHPGNYAADLIFSVENNEVHAIDLQGKAP